MKILLETTPLSRGNEFFEHPTDFQIQGQKEIQIASFLRAKNVKIFDRGNVQILITFKLARQHATSKAAAGFLIKHTAEVTNVHGNATFDLEDDSQTSFYLTNASVRNHTSSIDGLTTHHTYELIGSEVKPFV